MAIHQLAMNPPPTCVWNSRNKLKWTDMCHPLVVTFVNTDHPWWECLLGMNPPPDVLISRNKWKSIDLPWILQHVSEFQEMDGNQPTCVWISRNQWKSIDSPWILQHVSECPGIIGNSPTHHESPDISVNFQKSMEINQISKVLDEKRWNSSTSGCVNLQ